MKNENLEYEKQELGDEKRSQTPSQSRGFESRRQALEITGV